MENANTTRRAYDGEDTQSHRLAESLDLLRRNPMSLISSIEELDDRRVRVSVFVLPNINAAEHPGRREPFHPFAGELCGNRADQLRSALKSIGLIYGVDTEEALAIMGQTLLLLTALRQVKEGKTPTLPGPFHMTNIDLAENQAYVDRVNRPRISAEQALEFWLTVGAGIDLRQIWKPPVGLGIGRLFYHSFPPIWLTKEDLSRLNRDRPEGFSLPMQVNPEHFAAVESFSRLLEHTQQTGLPMELMVASPGYPAVEEDPPNAPNVELTDEELKEYDRHQFKCRLPIEINGQVVARKSNEVRIAGVPVTLPDGEFLLFLRLVVGLHESENGFVFRGTRKGGGLVDEGIYSADSLDQVLNRLRYRLGPALQGLDEKKFIEVRRRNIRLSTHRRYVLINRAEFLKHDDARIQELAARLTED